MVDDLAVALQKLVRLKEAVKNNGYCQCWYCGEWGHWKEMDGCHYVSRTHQATKVDEENIHPGCKGCNLRAGKGDSLLAYDYKRNMIEFYGEDFVLEIEQRARKPADHFRCDIEDRIKEVRAQCRELEKEL